MIPTQLSAVAACGKAPETDVTVDRITQYRARPGPHDWGSSWEGLTQTRPGLLPYAGALRVVGSEELRTRGFRVPRFGVLVGSFNNSCLSVLAFPHFHLTRLRDGDPSHTGLSVLVHPHFRLTRLLEGDLNDQSPLKMLR